MKDDKYLDQLFLLAKSHPKFARARICAALVHKNQIISYGFNQQKTHPLQKKFSKNKDSVFLHAEVDCIINSIRNGIPLSVLEKSTLYVARARNVAAWDNTFIKGLAKPCAGCTRCIESFKIKKVIYTHDNG